MSSLRIFGIATACAVFFSLGFVVPASAADERLTRLDSKFAAQVRPLIKRLCQECHSDDLAEAEINLSEFQTFAEVRKHPKTWVKVRQMLATGQMPPKDAPQPTEAERATLRDWVQSYLQIEAEAHAGDPGRVVLRRLNNAEYTWTMRDLTGIATLDPAREFPVDGAAGEGFTNTGGALVMSPSLITKYLDAAKEISSHAVLLPDGFRFSPATTRRDWTNEVLADIRDFYLRNTIAHGGPQVNLHGLTWDSNEGGRLPLEKYLEATLIEREALISGAKSIETVAQSRGLNAKYLGLLWSHLTDPAPSLLLGELKTRWQGAAPKDAPVLAAHIAAWQKTLWKFSPVGHIGKVGGPQAWMESQSPVVTGQDLKLQIPATPGSETTLWLVARTAGDGADEDVVIWQRPRLVAPGRPDVLLKDVRAVYSNLSRQRTTILSKTTDYLKTVEQLSARTEPIDIAAAAKEAGLDAESLRAWLDYLGVGTGASVELKGLATDKLAKSGDYDFIQGWGSDATPLFIANSSDMHVRVPGNMPPHSVAVHPSPTLRSAVGWRSPVAASLRVEATIQHAHPECGNGVSWSLELRRGATRRRLATGIAHGAAVVNAGPFEDVAVRSGDVISLIISARDNNHSCDLTQVDLKLTNMAQVDQEWRLTADVSPDILAGNPHADRQGHERVWHLYTEADQAGDFLPVVPPGSLLAKWQGAADADEKTKLAEQVKTLLTSEAPAGDSPDAALHRTLTSLGGPLLSAVLRNPALAKPSDDQPTQAVPFGLDPALFGKLPDGTEIDAQSLAVQAPQVLEIKLPTELAAGCDLVTGATLAPLTNGQGTAQVALLAQPPGNIEGTSPELPILCRTDGAARTRMEEALDNFRQLFPAAVCYTRIVPVDEVVTLTLFYREDAHLVRLMLSDSEKARLDRMWDELRFISQDSLTLVDAYLQLMEYATQDADPSLFEPLRKPINDRAAAFRQRLIDSEPAQLEKLIEFANTAWRRNLTKDEQDSLRALYATLRAEEIPHDKAFRMTLARLFVGPAFLYHIEKPSPGKVQSPVADIELASRLSYFLWSSQPDKTLRDLAQTGRLGDDDVLMAQLKRMTGDARIRRFATEFACQWLHIHDFENLDEKSERHFPTFNGLRGAMYEESIQFFTDLFQHDGRVDDMLTADYTWLNEDLAKHYGIPDVQGPEWRRVDGVARYGRGGILTQATTLSKQSGASRTSPILRGNWVSEVLLGERLPRPPKDVPPLPDDEGASEKLSVRQLIEQHSSNSKCAVCHERIDAFGFSLERYDAIGRLRDRDAAGRPIDDKAKTMDGTELVGADGLRDYLLTARREAFVKQFCKKLLGYALARGVQLSDEPLLAEMHKQLMPPGARLSTALELIVRSPQFREIRGQETADDDE